MNSSIAVAPMQGSKNPFVDDRGFNLNSYQFEHFQVFVHFAKLFVERFQDWELFPDPQHPLTSVVVRRKDGDRCIVSTSMDGVQVLVTVPDAPAYIYQARTDEFYLWALGVTNVPDFVNK